MANSVQTPIYYDCGICGHNHPIAWDGDCRDDANRFTDAQLDEKHGADKWLQLDMQDADAASSWRIHHDVNGFYLVKPGEWEDGDGPSLGFDGRSHYATAAEAVAALPEGVEGADVEGDTPALTPREQLKAAMDKLGLSIESEFVPCSKSRNAPGKRPLFEGQRWQPTLNWKVRLVRTSKGFAPSDSRINVILETDYSAGLAYCPAYKATSKRQFGLPGSAFRQSFIDWECEHGIASRGDSAFGLSGDKKQPILPDSVEVVHSLVQDSDVLDAGGFESWASDFGYDADSRKAEAIYKACLDIALKLRAAIGDDGLKLLREAGQDL